MAYAGLAKEAVEEILRPPSRLEFKKQSVRRKIDADTTPWF